MTNGSSQGLFVIVAVVIFGIFIAISYLLFRDKLQTGLASIFTDSIITSKENLVPYQELKDLSNYYSTSTYDDNSKEYSVHMIENTGPWNTSGFQTTNNIKVPYGYRLYISFDIYTDVVATVSLDLNAYTEKASEAWNASNDNYGDVSNDKRANQRNYSKTMKNTWSYVEFWYENNHVDNINKLDIFDKTSFGIKSTEIANINSYKIKNIKYKVVKL